MTPEASPMGSPVPSTGLKAPATELDKFYAEAEQHASSEEESSEEASEQEDDDQNGSEDKDSDSDT
jgi:hypothetical protein